MFGNFFRMLPWAKNIRLRCFRFSSMFDVGMVIIGRQTGMK